MTSVKRLDGAFGVAVEGVDLSQGVEADTMHLLTQTLYENRIIVIRNQRLSQDAYLQFGRQWGSPIPHVLDHMRMPGYPELMAIGNTEEKDRKDDIRNAAALWHTDQSYEDVPASATMLYAIKVPQVGGETQFCDMVTAYDDLDEATKTRLDGLDLAHKYGRGNRRADELVVSPLINEEQDQRVPPVYHPLVLPHPITGRKGLYALGHGAYGVKGMPEREAEDLIAELKEHVLQEKYIYRHKYAVGDIAVWDTFQTMHSAVPIEVATSEADARLLWRISIRGKPRIYEAAVV
ncbi:MAG: TauD/TfdA family dioxygenase [Candidatus Tectomicrobia bacterium]|nr:TauD/TfdA family dioxygenase [Candidatus Tectomicrobia bacterium]